MKITLIIIQLIYVCTSSAQCILSIHSRKEKKIEIGTNLFRINAPLNLVDHLVVDYRYHYNEVPISMEDRSKIVRLVSKYLQQNSINTERFNFNVESLYKLNTDSMKVCCPILAKQISADYCYYCEGQIYIEKNVYFNFPLVLDRNYNVIQGDCSKIGMLKENIISICKAYSLLKKFDKKIELLEIVGISIEPSADHINMIFKLTDYRLTPTIDNEHHYMHYYYQINLENGTIFIRASEDLMDYDNCG